MSPMVVVVEWACAVTMVFNQVYQHGLVYGYGVVEENPTDFLHVQCGISVH